MFDLAAEAITRLRTMSGSARADTHYELASGRKVSSLESQLSKATGSKRKPDPVVDTGASSPPKKVKAESKIRDYNEELDKGWITKPDSGHSVFLSRGKVEVHTDVAAPAMKVTPKDV